MPARRTPTWDDLAITRLPPAQWSPLRRRAARLRPRTVSVRARGIQKDLGAMDLEQFAQTLAREIATRGEETVVEKLGQAP